MKRNYFLGMLLFLQGCTYSEGCWYSPQYVYCSGPRTGYPYVAQFQKQYSIGHTNSELRWIDIKSCGGENISKETNKFNVKNERDPDGSIIPEVVEKFEECMKNKGYVVFYPAQCGYQERPKGKCNL